VTNGAAMAAEWPSAWIDKLAAVVETSGEQRRVNWASGWVKSQIYGTTGKRMLPSAEARDAAWNLMCAVAWAAGLTSSFDKSLTALLQMEEA
jgi:hypothetical protein